MASGCFNLTYFSNFSSINSNRERAIDYLNTCELLYVFDGYAGWDPVYRIKVRIICSRAYHALFMNDMLIRPTREELAEFGEPGYCLLFRSLCS